MHIQRDGPLVPRPPTFYLICNELFIYRYVRSNGDSWLSCRTKLFNISRYLRTPTHRKNILVYIPAITFVHCTKSFDRVILFLEQTKLILVDKLNKLNVKIATVCVSRVLMEIFRPEVEEKSNIYKCKDTNYIYLTDKLNI